MNPSLYRILLTVLLLMLRVLPPPFGAWLFWKMVGSTGFVAVALAAGGLGSTSGRTILVGTALCWIGDLVLTWSFTAGLVSFLLAHVAFSLAFWLHGASR